MKTRLLVIIAAVATTLTAHSAVTSSGEAATMQTAMHKKQHKHMFKHHKHTFKELPSNDDAGSLRIR